MHTAIPADGQNPSLTEIFYERNRLLIAKDTFLVDIFDKACPIRYINNFLWLDWILCVILPIARLYEFWPSPNFKSELFGKSLLNLSAFKKIC